MTDVIQVHRRYYVETPLGLAEVWYLRVVDLVEHTAQFGVFQVETKENWWWPNSEVRLCGSISAKRDDWHTPIHLSEERIAFLLPHIQRHHKSQFYWKVNDGKRPEQA